MSRAFSPRCATPCSRAATIICTSRTSPHISRRTGDWCSSYTDPKGWAHKAILNVAASGKFSSDRTIAEYAADIWGAKPCPVQSA